MKRYGRRSLDGEERSVSVTVVVPPKQFDDLCREAFREQVSVPEIIRRKIRRLSVDCL